MVKTAWASISVPRAVVDRIERIRKELPQLGFRSISDVTVRAIEGYLTELEVKYGVSVTPRAERRAAEALPR